MQAVSSHHRRWVHFAPCLLALLLAVEGCASPHQSTPQLCAADERPVYSCALRGKLATVCAKPLDAPFVSATYRYGVPGKIELQHTVAAGGRQHFLGRVGPLNPRASLEQLSFENGNFRYVLTSCVGGSCPHRGGLHVFKRSSDRPLYSVACDISSTVVPAFDPDFIDFGADLSDTRLKNQLVELTEREDDVTSLYPVASGGPWKTPR